jgi:ribonucleoside-diphosphate reductase alpha chain
MIMAMSSENREEDTPEARINIDRLFTKVDEDVYDRVTWDKFEVTLKSDITKDVIFHQKDVEFPTFWSEDARMVVADKYFKMVNGVRESSLRQLLNRLTLTITRWGEELGYFPSSDLAMVFRDELTHLLLHQYAAFNSPVYFNIGIPDVDQQCSACFILGVEDDMEAITDVAKIEARIFKRGSGSGINLSKLRAKGEPLSPGGHSSGAIAFMDAWDKNAGVIKSGGSTRRAAKMVVMDCVHPEVYLGPESNEDFIGIKAHEEDIAWALHKQLDLPLAFNHSRSAYLNARFQNANNSVSIKDAFMLAVLEDKDWETLWLLSGETANKFPARDMFHKIAEATWRCGDPGIQFTDRINQWHTCKKSGKINSSNPCSEFLFLDWSACNLASLNLIKFFDEDGKLDLDKFLHAIRVMIIAQDIIVEAGWYPDPRIEKNAHEFRPLGLGYTNLGGLLMSLGIPYDSDEGRHLAASLTSILTSQAYLTSIDMARTVGSFKCYKENKDLMLQVIGEHLNYANKLKWDKYNLSATATQLWDEVLSLGREHGFRNAQVTLMAPTGTISFMMDARSTGMEPLLGLAVTKSLVGEGEMELVAQDVVEMGLDRLGYDKDQIAEIITYMKENKMVEGCEILAAEHLPMFDCSFLAPEGTRCLEPMAHIKMVEAIQPFLSGGISKTINVPEGIEIPEIENLYMEAWRRGLKSISIYRDNSKGSQPLNIEKKQYHREQERMKLPDNVFTWRHKFGIGNHSFYLQMGFYPDGRLGEVFIFSGREGGMMSGTLRAFAKNTSYLLQQGVSLKYLCRKHLFEAFEPRGFSSNKIVGICESFIDYIFKWMAFLLLEPDDWTELGIEPRNLEELTEERKRFRLATWNFSRIHLGTKEGNGHGGAPNLRISLGICDRCGGPLYPQASCKFCIKCKQTTECA